MGYIQTEEDWQKPLYRNRGLAQLLTAVSIVLLRYLAIDTLQTGSLSRFARRTWAHYGVEENSTTALDHLVTAPDTVTVLRKAFALKE